MPVDTKDGTGAGYINFDGIGVFSTSPQSLDCDRTSYRKNVIDVAQWSEQVGCRGILVYTDNGIVDPWLVAQIIIENTESLVPLVAVQPVYMHPYSVAKKITSLAYLHNRRVALNMVAGGFKNDLTALNDQTPHDKRYQRVVEYTTIVKLLLSSESPVSFAGEFYKIDKLTLKPVLPPELMPDIFVSGSSEAGIEAAAAMGATAVKYPGPPAETAPNPMLENYGIRVGIIARSDADVAWEAAFSRFPNDRRGEIAHQLAMKVSDSAWHKQLSAVAATQERHETYWLGPFQSSKSNCPYLVGSYQDVANEVERYLAAGYKTFILDIPPSRDELEHIRIVFRQAANAQTQWSHA